jgi:hypothetical protein
MEIIAFSERALIHSLLIKASEDMKFSLKIIKFPSLDIYRNLMELHQEFDVVIFDLATKVSQFDLRPFLKNIPRTKELVILGEYHPQTSNTHSLELEDLQGLRDLLERKALARRKKKSQYISIPLIHFTHLSSLPFDLYERIPEEETIPIIAAKTLIADKILEQIKGQGAEELFFSKELKIIFSVLLVKGLIRKIEQEYKTKQAMISEYSKVFKTLQDLNRSLGAPTALISICEKMVASIFKQVSINDDFSKFHSKVINCKDGCIKIKNILLASWISIRMLRHAGLSKRSEEVIAAIFFSELLKDKEAIEFARINEFTLKNRIKLNTPMNVLKIYIDKSISIQLEVLEKESIHLAEIMKQAIGLSIFFLNSKGTANEIEDKNSFPQQTDGYINDFLNSYVFAMITGPIKE